MTLLARIFADPDDDHAREIVADALQEKGDPHGTLIALQMALAKLGPDEDLERDELQEEIEAYLLEHGDDIREALGVADLNCRFERGFVHEVELTAKALAKNVETIIARSPVRHIRITRGDAPALRAAFAKLAGSTVRALTLEYMYPEGLAEIFGELALPLESLDLAAGEDTAEEILRAKCCRTLKSLRVSTYHIQEAGGFFRALPESLERLELAAVMPSAVAKQLATAPCAKNLRSLAAINSAMGDEAFSAIVASMPNLRELDVSACSLHARAVTALAKAALPLEVLRLGSNMLDAPAIAALLSIPQLAGLRELRVGGQPIGDVGTRALAATKLDRLRHLDVSRAELASGDAGHIADWAPASLRVLHLHGNSIGDEGAAHLGNSRRFSELRELAISECAVGDAGLTAFARGSFDALRILDLSANLHIGEPGCLALAASKSFGRLKSLDLRDVRSGRAGGKALRTRFGDAVAR